MTAKHCLLLLCLTILITTTLFGVSFTRTSYPIPGTFTTADINRDGSPDLIIGDRNRVLTVLLGSPTGHFTINSTVSTTSTPRSIAAGDFTGDGFPDVVVLEEAGFELFRSQGNGTISSAGFTPLPGGRKIIALDLNGNHVPDIALNRCTGSPGCKVDTFLNNGSGVFTLAQERSLSSSTAHTGLVAGDFSRDGHDDLAVTDRTVVRILRSNNNGTFTQTATLTVSGSIGLHGLAAGDIDAGNGADLILQATFHTPDDNFRDIAYVYLNNGSGVLSRRSQIEMGGDSSGENILSDITGNNRLDLVHISTNPENGDFLYARYKSNGIFDPPISIAGGPELPANLMAGDFNRDSRHDLALTTGFDEATYTFLNTNAPTICAPPSSATLAAKVCSITKTGSNTFVVRGAGNSPVGVRRVELWVDGVKRYNSPDDQLLRTITLSSGSHRLIVQAVDPFGLTARVTRTVTVP